MSFLIFLYSSNPLYLNHTIGALFVFWIGRCFLADAVLSRTSDNETFQLVRDEIGRHSLRSSVLWRLCPFPELFKNAAISVMPVPAWPVATSMFLHLFPYSVLWTAVGVDAGAVLRATEAEPRVPSVLLAKIVAANVVFGVVFCPLILAWWIRDIKRKAGERRKHL